MEIAHPADYHAALYIRLSREDENEGPSESVNNQRALLEGFARQQSLDVFDLYIDDGWSGTNFERPAFQRMLADIEAKRVNMVITKDLSRLGRDYILTGHYMERYFPEKRVRYISLLDGIDTGVESSANDITPFRAIMNDMYAKDISKKIKSVKHDKQHRGQFIGGKPVYGYKMHPTQKNRIVIDEEAAAVVRWIFAVALGGASCRQIAAQLNTQGVPPPAVYAGLPVVRHGVYAGLWSSERIADMLQNETYTGCMVQGRSVKISYKSKKCVKQPRKDWIVVPNTHEPLIDRADFLAVGQLLSSRRHTRSRTYDFPLKGLIFCHECGYPLAVINRRNARGEDVLYFVCRTYQRFTAAGICTCHSIKEQTVMQAVANAIREAFAPFLTADRLLALARQAQREAQIGGTQHTESSLREKVQALTRRLDRIYMDKLAGLLEDADFERIYRQVKAERTVLERALLALSQHGGSSDSTQDTAQMLVERFLREGFADKGVLVSLIERVELTQDRRLILRWRLCQ